MVDVEVAVNPLGWHSMTGQACVLRLESGLLGPNEEFLGVDAAGRMEAVGEDVPHVQAGDAVFGSCWRTFAEAVRHLATGHPPGKVVTPCDGPDR